MLGCLAPSFQIRGVFLNIARESMNCICFHCLFNNYLDFTISSLLTHGPKSEILCVEPVFDLFVMYEKYIPMEFFLCSYAYILRAFGYTLALEGVLHLMVFEFG